MCEPRRRIVYIISSLGVSIILSSTAIAASLADAVARAAGLQGRVMWCDAEANIQYLSNCEGVADTLRRCKDAGINTVVVDVKPLSGYVLYNSKVAPHMSAVAKYNYPKGYDLLAAMIEEGHRLGLKVHASVNVFSEGSQAIGAGTAFDHTDWQCVNYEADYWVMTPSGEACPAAGVDVPVPAGRLYVCFKDSGKALADPTILRVLLDRDGEITAVFAAGQSCSGGVPPGGLVLAASGPAMDWLSPRSVPGGKLAVETRPRFTPVAKSSAEHLAVFVNPAARTVRDYELSVIGEIIRNYSVDGLILDRMRYPNIYADFSDLSRTQFESFIGQAVERWPEDIYQIKAPDGEIRRGKLFNQWLEWRARRIRDFLAQVRAAVKAEKPGVSLGVYVGSWYSDYYPVGVNWASPRYVPRFDWATSSYNAAGYADHVDYMCAGCYYPYATRAEARAAGKPESATVEAAAQASNEVVMDDTFVYPSLYLLDYANKPDAFTAAVQTALSSGQGVMLFDLVYVRNYDWWQLLKQAFAAPATAPHDVPGLLDKVRDIRRMVEQGPVNSKQ
ncbi:MAG: alpha amylase family protein [Armatimonadota bacterium]|nr:alpha amylase family protein [Armatimonadota bacterium]